MTTTLTTTLTTTPGTETLRHDALATAVQDERYAALRDRKLAARLAAEDVAEEAGLDPFERVSCRLHQRWLHQCVSSPAHVVAFTGHRWCRTCEAPASVAVDEWLGDVRVACTGCGAAPRGRATRQLIRACVASLAAAQDG